MKASTFLNSWAEKILVQGSDARQIGISSQPFSDFISTEPHWQPLREKQHGSPVEPQTLEALIVHSVDTLDAHAEMMRAAWLAADPNAHLIDAPRPLKGKLARSLKRSPSDE